jgi:hypothetical protein
MNDLIFNTKNPFIDFLDIQNRNLTHHQLTIFYWKSWTGKSSYLQYFYNKYKKESYYIFHKQEDILYRNIDKKYIFIDEIYSLKGLLIVIQYLLSGKKIFVASHLHPLFFIFLYPFYKTQSYITEKPYWKIEIYLKNRWYTFWNNSMIYFYKKYKSSFTDLENILETWKNSKNFDTIFYNFEQNYKVTYSRNTEN